MDTVLRVIKEAREYFPNMRVRLIISINRIIGKEEQIEIINLALKYKEAGNMYVVGVELSGDPDKGSFEDCKE